MALAFQWQRSVIGCACLLALGACEAVTAPEATEPPTAAVVDRSARVSSEIARGRQALAAGDLSTAQAAFTGALRGSPNDPEPAIGLAETYLALGDLDTAERLFGLVADTEAGADDPRLMQGRGLVALGQGRTDEAIGYLEQSVERDQALWRAWAGLGRAYGRQGKDRQARNAFDRAEESAPSPAVVINDTGMLHLEENDPAAALEAFQRALAVDPGNVTASANARIARAMLGDYDAAISGARPDELPHVLNNVGYIAIVNGDYEVADRLLRRAIEVSPVYHEAASANLDLLAQAMKGTPVPALASAGDGVAHASDGTPAVAVAASPAVAVAAPVTDVGSGRAPVDAWSSIDAQDAEADPQQALAPTGTSPVIDLASIPPQGAEAASGVMAHGFRWESKPVGTGGTGKKRGKRKAAQSSAPPDPADPRGIAWPAISVPAAEAPADGSAAAPGTDSQAEGAPQAHADVQSASAGAAQPANRNAPPAPADASATVGAQSTKAGLPE